MNVPNLAAHFRVMEWDQLQKRVYLLWAAAKESDFDRDWMRRRYPKLTAMGLSVMTAEKPNHHGGRMIVQVVSYGITGRPGTLYLLSGSGEMPVISTRYPSTGSLEWKGWVDPELDGLEFHQFNLIQRKSGQYLVAQHYYHPFPGDRTWPKFQLWIKVDDNHLILDRLERYDIPANENLLRRKYLTKTVYPK